MIETNELTHSRCEAELDLANVLEMVSRRLDAGEQVDPKSLRHDYPQHADELAKLLPTLQQMVRLARRSGGGLRTTDALVDDTSARDRPVLGTLGDYEILGEIGRGGMGVVYRARQKMLGREVAVKVLPLAALANKRQLQRFDNEARTIATLRHPHIVPIHSYGVERGVHYYAMEYIDGPTLAQVVEGLRNSETAPLVSTLAAADGSTLPVASRNDGGSSEPNNRDRPSSVDEIISQRSSSQPDYFRTVARWGVEIADALEHAHANGVVHRDVKPNNLLLDHEGQVLITDFGLAHTVGAATVTLTGDVCGTLRYMSPEQADGRFVDQRTDVYSLGVTLYELLALQPPFQGQQRQGLLKQISSQEPRRLRQVNPSVPAELETIVGKALAKDSGERYPTAGEFADDLRRFLDGRPIHARPPTVADRTVKWLRRNPGLVIAGVVVTVLVVLATSLSTAVVWQAKEEAEAAQARAEQNEAQANEQRKIMQRIGSHHHRKLLQHHGKRRYSIHRSLLGETWVFVDLHVSLRRLSLLVNCAST